MVLKLLSETNTPVVQVDARGKNLLLDTGDCNKERSGKWKDVEKEESTVSMTCNKSPNEINSFVQNIFIDESEEDVALWSDEGATSSDATISEFPREQGCSENYENQPIMNNGGTEWFNASPEEVSIDTNTTENGSEWNMDQRVNCYDACCTNVASEETVQPDSTVSGNNLLVMVENNNHLTMNNRNNGNRMSEYDDDGDLTSTWSTPGHSLNNTFNHEVLSMDNYMSGSCESSEEVSEWTDDGATAGRTNENEIIYMDAGTKIEKIIQNLNIIESGGELPSRANLLITTLRELTKELQSIINDRAQKIDELEMQCESQEILIKSHQEENEFILERIDSAMKELENTISEQNKKIDQLDKHAMSQDIVVENHINEKAKLLQRITDLENLLNLSNNDKELLCEKLVSYEKRFLLNRKDKEHLQDKNVHLEVVLNRQTIDKELLLERICNLEVELGDLMKNHNEEKDLLLERINHLEVNLNDAESCKKSASCVLSHDIEKQLTQQVQMDTNSRIPPYDPKIAYRHTIGMETTSHTGNNIYAYANTEAAINVIHNMLHKDKLTKLI